MKRIKQNGSTIFLSLVFMLGLFSAIGLGTDVGHWVVNKSRLQSALDAAALSAAITLLNDVNRMRGPAIGSGIATFNLMKNAPGNNELRNITLNDGNFEFSTTLVPFVSGSVPANFVRVSNNGLQVAPILIQIFPAFRNPVNISAVSTAGPVGQNCSLVPFVLCADTSDPNCNNDSNGDGNNDCYGYEIGQIVDIRPVCLGLGLCFGVQGAGKFTLLNLATYPGGNNIRTELQNPIGINTCTQGTIVNTNLVSAWGSARNGINDRFNQDTQTFQYTAPSYSPSAFFDYNGNLSGHGMGNHKREMAVPIANCNGLPNTVLPRISTACLFLSQRATGVGASTTVKAEFTGEFCPQAGTWSAENPTLNGPYRVVNFKSPGSNDS